MTPEEALRRIVEDADLIHRVVEHEELRPTQYLLVRTDAELFEYLATFKAGLEDMEPNGDDETDSDKEPDDRNLPIPVYAPDGNQENPPRVFYQPTEAG